MPAPDHPWYGPLGKLKRPRTLSDSLRDENISRAFVENLTPAGHIDDETVRASRDPSTETLYGGGAMRKPVRYD